MPENSLQLYAIPGIPLVQPGDELASIINNAVNNCDLFFKNEDILVIAQKIVSKAENRIVSLKEITPTREAIKLAEQADKDPRQVQLILNESNRIVRVKPGVIIAEHKSGIVLANAGIDHSNVEDSHGEETVTLLPEDANRSAASIRSKLQVLSGKNMGIIINDSVGRAWRTGTVGLAIGSSNVLPLRDLRGEPDLFGNVLRVSETADIDALASAATLLMGEAANGTPVVIIRGFNILDTEYNASILLRPEEQDLFR